MGYPVIVKPSVGVGANGAWKLKSQAALDGFYADLPAVPYVMEEFLSGDICTYDAILGSRCEPLFESMGVCEPVLDAVAEGKDVFFYTCPEPDPRLSALGRKTAKAFGADRRFVHFEFIRLERDYAGIGKAGDYAVLEVNMRPAGGHDPDMMNFAQSVDVYRIYADMVTADKRLFPAADERRFCAYAARKDGHDYIRTHAEIIDRYGLHLVMQGGDAADRLAANGPVSVHGEIPLGGENVGVFRLCTREKRVMRGGRDHE